MTTTNDEKEFEAWVASEDTQMHPEGREGYFANNNNFSRDYWIAERTWKAAIESERARSRVLVEACTLASRVLLQIQDEAAAFGALFALAGALEKYNQHERG